MRNTMFTGHTMKDFTLTIKSLVNIIIPNSREKHKCWEKRLAIENAIIDNN